MKNNYIKMMMVLGALIVAGIMVSDTKATTVLPGEEDYVVFAEKMPSPAGGIESIMKKINYPTVAKKTGIEGKVYVLVYINETGGVDNVKVIKGIGGGCDEAAADAVKSHKFTAAEHQGAAVKSKLSLSIQFKLN